MSNTRVNLFRGLSNALFYYMDEQDGQVRRSDEEIEEIVNMQSNPVIQALMNVAAFDWNGNETEVVYDELCKDFVDRLKNTKAPFTWDSRYDDRFLRRFADVRSLHTNSKAHKFMAYPINHLMALTKKHEVNNILKCEHRDPQEYDFFKIYRGFTVFVYNAFPNSEAHMIFNIINNVCNYSFGKRSTPQQKEELVRLLKLLA